MRPRAIMKVTLKRSYTSKNGNKVFVYAVAGTEKDLNAFKEAQGENYREAEDGTPLWFTVRCIGKSGKLIITTNGRIVPDMSEFDQASSLASQYGGNFGQELARLTAMQLMTGNKSVSEPVQAPATDSKIDNV